MRAVNHPIRVQHGHYLEDELVPELVGFLGVGQEEVDNAPHNPATITLSRVDPGR